MGRTIDRLSAKKIESLRKPGYHADGGNLFLQVSAALTKSWVFCYSLHTKSREMGLGPLHSLGLADAREQAAACRAMLLKGIDPIDARNAERGKEAAHRAATKPFKECALAYIDMRADGFKNAKSAEQWRNTLKEYCFPIFGNTSVRDVDTPNILRALEPIWTTKHVTASRLRGRVENILDWSTTKGYRSGDNPARWAGHLEHLLPSTENVRAVRSHPALPYEQMPAFMDRLRGWEGDSARALELLILCSVRTECILSAAPSEFDLERAIWTVPGGRMKGKKYTSRPFVVPLCPRAIEILTTILDDGQEYLFPGDGQSGHLSTGAMLELLKEMDAKAVESGDNGWRDKDGERITVHGFRSSFTDWAAEQTDHPEEVRKMALAHTISDKVEAAYRRGDMFKKRRRLAEDWADFCAGATRSAEVLELKRA